jgi:uncharacterized protein (TIRG00374 family)
MRRSILTFGLSFLLLVGFVGIIGPQALAAVLVTTDPLPFAVGFVAMLGALVCWSEGLRLLLSDAGGVASSMRTFLAYSTAMLGRQLVPMGTLTAPAVTAYTVDREVSLSYAQTLAVVTVAEFVSTVGSLCLIAVCLPVVLVTSPVLPQTQLLVWSFVVFVVVFALLTLAFWYRRRAVRRVVDGGLVFLQRTIGRYSAWLREWLAPARADRGLERFYGTIDGLASNRRTLVVSFGLHQVGWLCSVLPLYTSGRALGVDIPLSLVVLLVLLGHLVAVLPLPGGLGGVEIVLASLLTALVGVEAVVAAAVVLLYRLCSYWFLILVGAVAAVYT